MHSLFKCELINTTQLCRNGEVRPEAADYGCIPCPFSNCSENGCMDLISAERILESRKLQHNVASRRENGGVQDYNAHNR